MRVETSIRCRPADYMKNVRRKLVCSRWVGPGKPLVLRYAATFAEASDCSLIVADGGRGRLSALMATR